MFFSKLKAHRKPDEWTIPRLRRRIALRLLVKSTGNCFSAETTWESDRPSCRLLIRGRRKRDSGLSGEQKKRQRLLQIEAYNTICMA